MSSESEASVDKDVNIESLARVQGTPTADFTIYWKPEEHGIPNLINDILFFPQKEHNDSGQLLGAFEETVTLRATFTSKMVKGPQSESQARSCICRCFNGRFASATFRSKDKLVTCHPISASNIKWNTAADSFGKNGEPEFLVQSKDMAEALYDCISSGSSRYSDQKNETLASGLVVFSGSTNSAKSSVAQTFCLEVIRRKLLQLERDAKLAQARRPHLVTYEDPIEGWSIEVDGRENRIISPIDTLVHEFCLTAREKNKDVKNLSQALKEARRQTPSCFYIGEVRDDKEWKKIINFAGTGHLVVATTHASSISEAMARIFRACGASIPAKRSDVATQIAGCVHLRKEPVGLQKKDIVLPSAWIKIGASLGSLVADGLSSIVPNGEFVFNRSQFLDAFIGGESLPNRWSKGITDEDISDAKSIALNIDLQEMRRQ